ncbi:hypothetical protein C8Q77DRAFT_1106721 [Trametes polyzona]|nr:hypothetical protein C8Q77DRAFT_1106721 [Trametes polyzona]
MCAQPHDSRDFKFHVPDDLLLQPKENIQEHKYHNIRHYTSRHYPSRTVARPTPTFQPGRCGRSPRPRLQHHGGQERSIFRRKRSRRHGRRQPRSSYWTHHGRWRRICPLYVVFSLSTPLTAGVQVVLTMSYDGLLSLQVLRVQELGAILWLSIIN